MLAPLPEPPKFQPLPLPEPITTAPVEWTVVTLNNLPPGKDWVLIALTPQGYENLSRNLADGIRWSKEALDQLRYYRGEGPIAGPTEVAR